MFFLLLYDLKVVSIEAVEPFLFGTVAVLVGLWWMIDNRTRPLRVKSGHSITCVTLSPSSVRFVGLCFILAGLTEFIMACLFPTRTQPCSFMIVFGSFVIAILYEGSRRVVGRR